MAEKGKAKTKVKKVDDIDFIGMEMAKLSERVQDLENTIGQIKIHIESVDRKVSIVAGRMGVE
tara:strand:- start:295 stop:483 length:189 start_codon:yes stop_codon:yes gene_type:complete